MTAIKLSISQIIKYIEQGKKFEAVSPNGGFIIKVSRYVPFFCTAIHNGSLIRPELVNKIAFNDFERWHEEDPYTADFIISMPITVIGLDSRFEYDLNRHPDQCIYDEAWGKKVWKKKLSTHEIKLSKRKHGNYFRVIQALINKIESLFGGCLVFDIHSYNYKRWERPVPLFNVGTELIDKSKFGAFIEHWLKELQAISLPDIINETRENDVFKGKGYNLEFITKNSRNTLVLATEIKKIYCEEDNGDIYPKVLRRLQQRLKIALLNNAHYFSGSLKNWHHISAPKLLHKYIDEKLQNTDNAIFSLLKNFELLAAVNPTNAKTEKRKFFKGRYSELPVFEYHPIKINPYNLKQDLLSIPVQQIEDVSIRYLYESVVSAYTDKIDMLGSLNTQKFHYNSLRYFGRPSKKDLTNANYILHLPDIPGEAKKEPTCNASRAMEVFHNALDDYGIKAKIELSNKVISHIMVINSQKSILFQPEAKFKRKELYALIEHEIGVHMVTTMNSSDQKLKILNLGLPVNTETQEGLAILAEYLSGNITLYRLKQIALRVIIADMMCSGADFIECFKELINEYGLNPTEAFNMVIRIFRGGGFTKDYLYLSGFTKIYKLWRDQYDLTPLLVGKTSLPFYQTIEEMLDREMISKPNYLTKSILEPKTEKNSSIYEYIFSGLKH